MFSERFAGADLGPKFSSKISVGLTKILDPHLCLFNIVLVGGEGIGTIPECNAGLLYIRVIPIR